MLSPITLERIREAARHDLNNALIDYDRDYETYRTSFVEGVPDEDARLAVERARRNVVEAGHIVELLTELIGR